MAGDPWDTPAMRQFRRFKEQQPGCVLFFRMGDFYELFGDDAVEMSRVLGITLTERTRGVPMAGVPFHQKDTYLRRAVGAGYRVAVCDQIQDPKDAKGVVDRAVTQVVTPGTRVDEALLDEHDTAAVAAVVRTPSGGFHGAAADLSTGACGLFNATEHTLAEELSLRGVREAIYPEADSGEPPAPLAEAAAAGGVALTPRQGWQFDPREAATQLREQYGVATAAGFGLAEDDPALGPFAALLRYLRETQALDTGAAETEGSSSTGAVLRRTLAHLRPPQREDPAGRCRLDGVSLRALEIERTIRAEPGAPAVAGSLLGIFVEPAAGRQGVVRTAMGKRLLREWLCKPLSDADAILARQAAVATLVEDRRAAGELGATLAELQDVARIAGRVALGRATPRDLVALGRSLGTAPRLAAGTQNAPALAPQHEALSALAAPLEELAGVILASCVDAPPPHLRGGGLIRDGVDAELDEARSLQRDAGQWLADYQGRLHQEHDLPGLKVGFNKVFGYYIELPAAQARRAPAAFTRKQTLKNAERYVTPELKEFEEKVTTAEDRALARERVIFAELIGAAAERIGEIGRFAETAAELDTLAALAEKAHRRGWSRPEVVAEPVLEIRGGRHPVLDELLGERFVPNDVSLGVGEAAPGVALITGPNMAGKSTFIRQTALLALLASVGSFVPAEAARIGVCDRIFTRVGADDALHRGRSTFMVEMIETAAILNNAGPRSLVILDEIGRGTSTLDGLSLAWAISESLASEGGPRTLFATHYHELTELEDRLPSRVQNLRVAVREWDDQIVFVHQIERGRAGRSYGLHVARLAGVPETVVARAAEVLGSLSVEHAARAQTDGVPPPQRDRRPDAQMGLFTEFLPHPALDRLRELKLDHMTPMQAFDALRELRDAAEKA